MKGLSVRQPWASLIADGHKTIEWRSRRTSYRGEVVICSGKTPDDMYFEFGADEAIDKWPLGVAVATVTIADCRELTNQDLEPAFLPDDFDVCGFAWVLSGIQKIEHPYPVTGKQGLFDL